MVNSFRRSLAPHAWLILAVVAAVQVIGAAPTSSAGRQPADLFTEIYNRSLLKQKTVHSIRARFTETTTSSLLAKPLVAHGTVVAVNPGARVLMTYTDPELKTLTMDGKQLVIGWPARHERQQVNIADVQKRIDQYFTNASIKDLRSMFDVTAAPAPGNPRLDQIDMRPKRKQIQQGLERLELWVDRDANMLTQMRLTFPGGDQKTIALEDVTLNVPVTDQMFHEAR